MKHIIYYKNLIAICALLVVGFGCKQDKNPLAPEGPNGRSVGSSARELLSDAVFNSIIVEIHYMPGMKPADGTVSSLKDFIANHVNKSGTINVVSSQIPSGGKSVYSIGDVNNIEKNYRTRFNEGNTVAVHFLFLDGAYEERNVLGIAYKNTSLCIFERTIQDNSGGLLQPSVAKLETTVVNHEFGHILGLVDVGSPMQTAHKDTQHGNHCNNSGCLMYYQVETTDFVANLANSPVPSLDMNCRGDLRANGGR